MKKFAILLSIITISMIFLSFPSEVNAVDLGISAQAAVLIEAQTGKILYAKNENEKRPIASTTKIMTTLLTLESGNLDEPFIVDPNAIKVEGSSMGLQEGDTVTKRALCYGMLLPSGNDAANQSAIKVAGSFENFAKLMNARAKKIGMENTFFVTPSGLDAKGHGSSAFDMALLTREALKNPDFASICSQQSAKLCYGNPPYDRWLKNTNKLLSMYKGCFGVKTGFTDDAGRCLVSAAQRNGVTLICVTLKAPDDWNDHMKLFDYGFSILKKQQLNIPDTINNINLVGGNVDTVKINAKYVPEVPFVNGDFEKISSKVLLPNFVYAPVSEGDEVGHIKYYLNDREIADVPIIISEKNDLKKIETKGNFIDKIKGIFK